MNASTLLALCLPVGLGACSSETGEDAGSTLTTTPSATASEVTSAEETVGDGDSTTTDAETGTTTGDGDADAGDAGDGDGDTGDHVYAATIYLNFDGVELTSGTDDSTMNTTQIMEQAAVLEPYDAAGTGDMHLFVAQEIANDFAPYDVEIVIERPAEGPYTMIVVTPTNNVMDGISGTGPQDCNNSNPNNIGFAYLSSESTQNANIQAANISLIIGFTFGFDQVIASGDIMSASTVTPNPSWEDQCLDFDNPPGACLPQHTVHCTDGQNSAAELMEMFGAAQP